MALLLCMPARFVLNGTLQRGLTNNELSLARAGWRSRRGEQAATAGCEAAAAELATQSTQQSVLVQQMHNKVDATAAQLAALR